MGNYKEIIQRIRDSRPYEGNEKWDQRGLMPSDQEIIQILNSATDDFLHKIEKIGDSQDSDEVKLRDVNRVVDDLPWFELDTEEKEFLADVISPSIEAIGFNPDSII
jgi:hypothetical protein